jgi:predicted short-subunit dehydrogenase-like oxidoreductase (DUF2520 family)
MLESDPSRAVRFVTYSMPPARKKPKSKSALRSRRQSLPNQKSKSYSVAIIGAGRLGTALGLALRAAGHRVTVAVSRRPSTVRQAATMLGKNTLALSTAGLSKRRPVELTQIVQSSLILVSTPDDVVATVAQELAEMLKSPLSRSNRRGRPVVLHTSGALSSEVLTPLRSLGMAVGSLHPLVSITKPKAGAKLLSHAFFSVEGDRAAVTLARSLVSDLGGESFIIAAHHKALYHAAAVTASPQVTALFDIALEMLAVCGLSPNRARRVLLPLLESTVANLLTQDPSTALTGPFKRGDVDTVKKHLAALRTARLRDAIQAYVVLGEHSVAMARKKPVNAKALDELHRILNDVDE